MAAEQPKATFAEPTQVVTKVTHEAMRLTEDTFDAVVDWINAHMGRKYAFQQTFEPRCVGFPAGGKGYTKAMMGEFIVRQGPYFFVRMTPEDFARDYERA